MTHSARIWGSSALLLSTMVAPSMVTAQQYIVQNDNGGNYGQFSQTDWGVRQGIQTQDPGAAIVGELLQGIGSGLYAEDPKKHAVASHILNGLGNGLTIPSQPTVWQQGNLRQINQGGYNNWNNSRIYDPRGYTVPGSYPRPYPLPAFDIPTRQMAPAYYPGPYTRRVIRSW